MNRPAEEAGASPSPAAAADRDDSAPLWVRIILFVILAGMLLPMASPHGHNHGHSAGDGHGHGAAPVTSQRPALDLPAVAALRRGDSEARSLDGAPLRLTGRLLPVGPADASSTDRFLLVAGPPWQPRGPLRFPQLPVDADWILVSLPSEREVPLTEGAPIQISGTLRAVESPWGACSILATSVHALQEP